MGARWAVGIVTTPARVRDVARGRSRKRCVSACRRACGRCRRRPRRRHGDWRRHAVGDAARHFRSAALPVTMGFVSGGCVISTRRRAVSAVQARRWGMAPASLNVAARDARGAGAGVRKLATVMWRPPAERGVRAAPRAGAPAVDRRSTDRGQCSRRSPRLAHSRTTSTEPSPMSARESAGRRINQLTPRIGQ